MTPHMGRPRKEGNRDLPKGLHTPAGGIGCWRMEHPTVKTKKGNRLVPVLIRLKGVKTKSEAIEMYWAVMKHYQPTLEARAAALVGGPLTSDLIETYRTEELPTATSKSGKLLDDNTRHTYDNYLKNFRVAPEFNVPLSYFAKPDEGLQQVRKYLAQWMKNPRTYNNRLSVIARLFNYWIDKGLIVRNPCDAIMHRTPPKRDVYIPDDDFLLITDRLAEQNHEVYARACDWLYLMSGRPTNMLDVKEAQILDTPPEIHYYASKNDQPVIVERDTELDALIKWFREYKRTQTNDRRNQTGIVSPYLIVHPLTAKNGIAGKPITNEALWRRFKSAMRAVGLKGYTLRDIRPKALTDEAEIAGHATNKGAHKTQRMRDHYVKVSLPVRVRNNLKRLKSSQLTD